MALSDLRVLDLSRLLPGPFCTLLLADLGADVIKIEDPEQGDYLRHWPPFDGDQGAMFEALNRNKRSLVLNLKTAAGRDALLRLVATADVVVESFRPGVMERLGIGYATLREQNRGIVLCSITGYGQDGPYRDRAGHDLNYAGVAAVLDPERPQVAQVQLGDLGGGAFPAAFAIMAALHARQRSGEGQHCDISMVGGLMAWQMGNAARLLANNDHNSADILDGSRPCYGIYRCGDGHLTVAALEPKFWALLLEILDMPQWIDDAFAEGERGATVRAALEATFATRTRAQWAALFAGRDVCVEPVNRLDETLDPASGVAAAVTIPAVVTGGVAQLSVAPRLSGDRVEWRSRAPHQGEHSRPILAEAGYDDAAIENLINAGVTR